MSTDTVTNQTLFTAGQGGYHSYRIPALVHLPSGTVLAFCEARKYTGRDHDEIDLVLRRSEDGGQTWAELQIVVESSGKTCGNPCPIVDRDTGRVHLLFCKNNQWVFINHSADEGRTWSEPEEITAQAKDPAWSFVGTGPGHGIQLSTGRLLAPCWSDESPGPLTWAPNPNWGKIQSSYALYSDDHGQTWHHSANITTDATDECMAVELSDGTPYMAMRSRQDKKCRAHSTSHDGGQSWSPAEYDTRLPEPSCQGSILRDKKPIYLAHPSNPDDRTRLALYHSLDDCQTFSAPTILYKGPAAYSDLAATDSHLLCFFEADRSGRLVLARIDTKHLSP
ncbi:MAG: exo-alpha-sialidase [Gemmatimonadetes bacterium]|nr:exo-alpha-sialidase [Gemmatimonadota bacterium]